MGQLGGHLWTVWSSFRDLPALDPAATEWNWRTKVDDPDRGPVALTGLVEGDGDRSALFVLVHGLGGSAVSGYALRFAAEARDAGAAMLRLNLRGSDRRGEDYYHAALTADLDAALASPAAADAREIYLIGVSLGGHLVLRYLAAAPDPRVRAAACLSAPLDLAAGQRWLDRPASAPYRHYVLRKLKEIYRGVAARHPVPEPPDEADRIPTFREFDDRVIAPRFAFAGADDYYARASAGPHLGTIGVPTLFVACHDDPMVPAASLGPHLAGAAPALEVRWSRGGHVAFPGLDLGLGPAAPPEAQVLAWLRQAAG